VVSFSTNNLIVADNEDDANLEESFFRCRFSGGRFDHNVQCGVSDFVLKREISS